MMVMAKIRSFFVYLFSVSLFVVCFSCFNLIIRTSRDRESSRPQSGLVLFFPNNTSANSTAGNALSNTFMLEGHPTSSTCDNHSVESFQRESDREESCPFFPNLIRVYMYDLPPEFHFGLLGWKGEKGQIWPDVGSDINRSGIPKYPGGLNLQHSVEYWLTLDLLSSNSEGAGDLKNRAAVRAVNSSCADVIFVPFFASLSYNQHSKNQGKGALSRDKILQDKLVKFLMKQEEWKRSGGKNHLLVAHHPNSILDSRSKLGSMILVLSDFGRYPIEVANIQKDIIAPYMHLVKSLGRYSPSFEQRPTLLYFQGAIHRKDGGSIRQDLYLLLKDEKNVQFSYGSVRNHGIHRASKGMASSKFCLNIAGDTPSSNRLFDAIVSHCVPVIISDNIELPFEDVLDYSEFCIFVHSFDAVKKGFLLELLEGIGPNEWTKMWRKLKEISHHFEFEYPSRQGDAVQMIWEAIARRLPSVRLRVHRGNRFRKQEFSEKARL